MKAINSYDKLRGGYYTPADIAQFIIKGIVKSPDDSILEPSCGDGSFLAAIKTVCPMHRGTVTAVELDPAEAAKAESLGFAIDNMDFFTFYENNIEGKRTFDAIVGNPPFIRYQNFDEKYREVAFRLMKAHGFTSIQIVKDLANIDRVILGRLI